MPDMIKQIEEAYKAFEVAEKKEMSQKDLRQKLILPEMRQNPLGR